jgi:hypothetical protein
MRGYRQVSFKQFSEQCKFKKVFAAFPAAELCEDLSIYSGCSCCPSFCARWRNVNRANAKVVKITVRAKRPVQQAQPESITYCDNRFCVSWDCGVCELDQCHFVAA